MNVTERGTPAVGGGPQLSSASTPSSLSQRATPAASAPRSLLARCELAHLRGGGTFLISDVHGLRVTVEVDPVGVDDDQLRAALADRLLDAQVDDRHVGLDVGRDDDDD